MQKHSKATSSPFMTIADFNPSSDPRAAKADISNAPHLFGDPSDDIDYGDAAYGDAAYGDPSLYDGQMSMVGDPSSAGLDTFSTLIGAPKIRLKPWMKTAALGVGAGAAGYGLATLIQSQKRRAAQARLIQQNLDYAAGRNTITNSVIARRLMGKIPKNTPFQFYSIEGATLNQYPLAPTEVFPVDSLKYNFDRQSSDTPFEVEIRNAVPVGPNLVATATGAPTNRFFAAIIVTIGINALSANPGTVMTITANIPTINGTLSIAANPFSFTFGKDYYAKFIIYPWQLVTNKPLLALGAYSNADPITLTVSGVPLNSSVNLIVPGSLHQWTLAMRNRLV